MDYQRIYDELMEFRKTNFVNGYSERHHIKMRSLGGSDEESNLVRLTAREHYIAHLLLTKFNSCTQTACALWMMQCKSEKNDSRPAIKSSRMYEWARKEFVKYISKVDRAGKKNSQYGTRWVYNIETNENMKILKDSVIPSGWCSGRKCKHTDAGLKKISDSSKERIANVNRSTNTGRFRKVALIGE